MLYAGDTGKVHPQCAHGAVSRGSVESRLCYRLHRGSNLRTHRRSLTAEEVSSIPACVPAIWPSYGRADCQRAARVQATHGAHARPIGEASNGTDAWNERAPARCRQLGEFVGSGHQGVFTNLLPRMPRVETASTLNDGREEGTH